MNQNYRTKLMRAAMTLVALLATTMQMWGGFILHQSPIGYLDGAEGRPGYIHVWGWTCDPYLEIYHKEEYSERNQEDEGWKILAWLSTPMQMATANQVIISLWNKDGVKVFEKTFNTNVKRDDAMDYVYRDNKDSFSRSYASRFNIGFDVWFGGVAPGEYTVVAYGTNVRGNQGNTHLSSDRTVVVTEGYPINYDANTDDAVGSMPDSQGKPHLQDITLSNATPTREGYDFCGWNTERNSDGKHYAPGATYSTDAGVTLYAQWVHKDFAEDWERYGEHKVGSIDDWNDLVVYSNNEQIPTWMTEHCYDILLTADLEGARPIGTPYRTAVLNIYGDYHTITVDINDTKHEGTALLRYFSGKVNRLTVKGTVRGGKNCSGLIGMCRGGATVEYCDIQTNVITNSSHCSGVVANVQSHTCVVNTLFSGSIRGATQATSVFVGDGRYVGDIPVQNCLLTGTVSGANIKMMHCGGTVADCFKTTNTGQQGTYTTDDQATLVSKLNVFNYGKPKWSVMDGRAVPFDQLYIRTAEDWNTVVDNIENGESYKGRKLVLADNITVTRMLGTAEQPFDGVVDGNNHTLTFNLETTESGCAPFRYIKDAEFYNLKIDGTIYQKVDGKSRLAGIAAYASGKNKVTDCVVSSIIRCSNASLYHAGLVAEITEGNVIFTRCVFNGKLLGGGLNCGGMVGINNGYGTRFTECFFAPEECTFGDEGSYTISRDIKESAKLTNTFYTQQLGYPQGLQAYYDATGDIFRKWCPGGNTFYVHASPSISGLRNTYSYNNGSPVNVSGTLYCEGNKMRVGRYTASIWKNSDDPETPSVLVSTSTVNKGYTFSAPVTEAGSYTLDITAEDASDYYHGSIQKNFWVINTSLATDDNGHYLISSAEDWNTLCGLASDRLYEYFDGKVVELTNDITVTQQLGIFCGVLAGNGHTLTFNYGTTQNPAGDYAAPIYNLSGDGIVENLHVNGTIITSGHHAGGIAAYARDNARINNCRSSIRIKSTYNGACHNGGFVGVALSGNVAITDCLFDGCGTSENATHWAGFVGEVYNAAVSLTGCLYFDNRWERNVPTAENATFYLPTNSSTVSLRNCCYTPTIWARTQGTLIAEFKDAGAQVSELGTYGWRIDFDWPQWQAVAAEQEEIPLAMPRFDYRSAAFDHIEELNGSGTAADPYLISTTADWNTFVTNINNGVDNDAYYKLTTDSVILDLSRVAGTSYTYTYTSQGSVRDERRHFRGTFDGDGHTLNLDVSTYVEGRAPFLFAKDATFKNLNIAGTFNTSNQHAAGLIVNAEGDITITGCRNSLTINSSYSGAGEHGGFVAVSSGTTNIDGCLFDGSIIGATTRNCGGFVGKRSDGTVNITGSFFTPRTITLANGNNSATFCAGATITNCCHTQPLGTAQGTRFYSITAAEGIDLSVGGDGTIAYSSGITFKGDGLLLDGVYYGPAGVEVPIDELKITTGYSPQDATIAPNAGTYANGKLTMPAQNVVFSTNDPIALSTYTIHFDANGGTGEAMADMHFTYGDAPLNLIANTFTRTANNFVGWNTEPDGSGTAYADGKTVENLTTASGTVITLFAQWEPWIAEGFGKTDSYTPNGTADYPFIINTAEEWDLLCDYVSSDKDGLASCHYLLGSNITVSRTMGTETNPFRGVFEGASRTLTLDLAVEDAAEESAYVEPENGEAVYISIEDNENGEPENGESGNGESGNGESGNGESGNEQTEEPVVKVLPPLAPFSYVNGAIIRYLRTMGTIDAGRNSHAGGIVGRAEGSTTLQSCYSSVTVTSTARDWESQTPVAGGMVGQSTGTLNFIDCLFDGTINAEYMSNCGGFLGRRESGTVTFTNCLTDGVLNCYPDGSGTFYLAEEENGSYTITNSYYHTAYGESQGTLTEATGETLRSSLGDSWTVMGEEFVVPFVSATDLRSAIIVYSPAISWTGDEIAVSYTVKNFYGDPLNEDDDYTAVITNAGGTASVVVDPGEYTLTVTGMGDYTGAKTVHFYVYKNNGEAFPLQIDRDFQEDEDGYFYVNMPGDGQSVYDKNGNEITIPAEHNPKTVIIPEGFTRPFKVYDSGGKKGDYDNSWTDYDDDEYNEDGEYSTLTLTCPEGYVFRVQGTIDTYESCDELSIYDGSSTSCATLLNGVWGDRTVVPIISSGNSITFYFEHDGMDEDSGFDLTVSLVPQIVLTLVENSVSYNGATVSWTGVSESCMLEIAEVMPLTDESSFVWTTVAGNATSPYTFDNLDLATTYAVRVKSPGSDTPPSNTIRFTTLGHISTPTDLTLVANSLTAHGATVSWTGSSDSYNVLLGEVRYIANADFETGDLSQGAFTTTGSYPWTVVANNSGGWCAKSTNDGIENYEGSESDMVLEVTLPTDKTLTFSAKVSSEVDYDKAYFSIDGNNRINGISGDGDWIDYEYPLTAGTHTLCWYFTKDSSGDSYDDCFYVDDIRIVDQTAPLGVYTSTAASYTFTGLLKETDYVVMVQGVGENETSAWSEAFHFTTPIACPKPTDLTAGTPGPRSVELSWTENGEATQWQICINGDENNLTLVNTNPYTLSGLISDTEYAVKVRAYKDEIDQSRWSNVVTFHTEMIPTPANVTVSNIAANSATISWNSDEENFKVKYREATYAMNEVFFDSFENGLGNWTTYAVGQHNSDNWEQIVGNYFKKTDNYNNIIHQSSPHSGTYVAMSRSYYPSNGGDVSVDNWLVSPQMTLGDVLKFWVAGDNSGYQEHFAVYVSTETNAISDFELVEEPALAPGDGSWAERIVDLSAYAGQQGYIAIRHTDTAKDYLLLDDFGVYQTYTYGAENTVTSTTSSCELTGLYAGTTYEVQVQADGGAEGASNWSSPIRFTTDFDLILVNAADNSDVISKAAANGGEFNVTLANRTLWKDGDWNTLCLPFNLTIADSPLDGDDVEVRTLSSATFENGKLTLDFTPATGEGAVTELQAGTPYIIKWTSGSNLTEDDLMFTGVTIDATARNQVCDLGDGKSISFVGTYSPVVYNDANKHVLFLGSGSTLYYPDGEAPSTINACRAYFMLNGITAGDPASGGDVKAFKLNFGDDATGIISIDNGKLKMENEAGAWFDLNGRRLSSKPSARGIYINNGKKIVFK